MSILNRTLLLLTIIILLSPISTLALDSLEYNEDLPNLRLEGSDTYNDGTIILLFSQGNNETRFNTDEIHLRIIFVNRQVNKVKIDLSSYPDLIPKCKGYKYLECSLNPSALIDGYVLIESFRNNTRKQMIVTWDGTIQSVLNLCGYQLSVAFDSKQDFLITESKKSSLIWSKFTVKNNLLKEEKSTYNVSKSNTNIDFYETLPLVEGGYATIIFTKTIFNNNKNESNEIYIVYFKDVPPYKRYLLHSFDSMISENEFRYFVGGFKNSFDGSGYTYLFFFKNHSFRIHFLSNGAVTFIDVNYLNRMNEKIFATPLFYGDYLGQSNNSLVIYDDNFQIKHVLDIPYDNENNYISFIMQKQSLFWSFNYNYNQKWNINYYPINSIDTTDSRYIYQNPSIIGTYPKIDEIVQIPSKNRKPFDFIINYNKPIMTSNENIIIYQYLNDNDIILRQIIPGQSEFCQLINETAISIKIFVSTLHQINAKYGIRVENNFVKIQFNEEPLLQISERIWTFNTSLETPEKLADQVTFIARLIFDEKNIKFYEKITSKHNNILKQLKDELVQAIPIDPIRLKIHKKVQIEDSNGQVLISATIMPPTINIGTERSTDSVLKDLNELIQQKKYNIISNGGITRFLDENYGVIAIPDFWTRYKNDLIILLISTIITGIIILYAHYKYPEGKNFFSIIKIILVTYDLILDIAFVIISANDVPYLFVFSLSSVVIPILFNMTMTIYSLIQEIVHNKDFNKWCKENGFITSIFTVLSSADVEALHILSSKIAGLNAFSAPPLSAKISRLVFLAGFINIFLEDIPQFIIQTRIQRKFYSSCNVIAP
ncbi:hypothetical protein C1645_859937 [Glomus cerebriforme]|uniref:Sterol-sensing domain of SREBP cleavage-activation-domain-containing protein n=1 Tax=Glomus cerebriforme TaxID=658196 RepID=A0A397SEM9_9GLOM|nr:hypothetical protein C1645_859937 [Glomus cerebriforme]